ncbi:MAG: twitching motility protein PilT [Candidatus Syntrophoarchaeum caldarius]|uniref:Twitching motility protein PilT n=1 Tax=Candidatus Syntropharchaeum caldarium TaxID=1838285 RepID=A0A1F2P9I3_9EURY|nr:MAG: twitching motility protein PilT [Candidatus Syntrophoarchaeum caldarius]
MILIDSYGWIEYFADGPLSDKYADYIKEVDEESAITPAIVVYEVYRKIKNEVNEEAALEAYAQMMRTRIISLDDNLAITAADFSLIYEFGMADAIVYATARSEGAIVVTSDKHFKGLEGVEFIE